MLSRPEKRKIWMLVVGYRANMQRALRGDGPNSGCEIPPVLFCRACAHQSGQPVSGRRLVMLRGKKGQLSARGTAGESGVWNFIARRRVELEETTNRRRGESRAHNLHLAAASRARVAVFWKCSLEKL